MKISIIVAISNNNIIGNENKLLWHQSEDMKRFKSLTTNKVVLMGHNTYKSLPPKFRPLPNRINVVISRNEKEKKEENLYWFNDIKSAIDHFNTIDTEELIIIGGSQIYKQTMNLVDTLYITTIKTTLKGDSSFVENWQKDFLKISSLQYFKDENNQYDYSFETWIKNK